MLYRLLSRLGAEKYLSSSYFSSWLILAIDTVVSVFSTFVAYLLIRGLFPHPVFTVWYGVWLLAGSCVLSVITFILFRTFRSVIRHTTFREVWKLGAAVLLKDVLMFVYVQLFPQSPLHPQGISVAELIGAETGVPAKFSPVFSDFPEHCLIFAKNDCIRPMGTVACGQIFKGASRSFTYRHERLWYRDEFPYHQHPEYEITVVFSGNGQRVTNDFTEPFREGEVVVLPPYFPHGWVYDKALCAPDGMIENGSLQFGEEFLVQLSQLSPEFQPVVRFYKELRQAVGLTGETAVRVRKLLAGLERSSDPERFVTLLQLLFLIAQDGHCRPIGPGKFRGAKIHKNKQRLQDVYKYIVENYHRKITLEEIASYASMNKTAFCLFFKKATGESFVAYLNVFRLQMACTMLTRSSKNISEICYAVGFTDIPYFNRAFKQRYGVSPTQYRASMRNAPQAEGQGG